MFIFRVKYSFKVLLFPIFAFCTGWPHTQTLRTRKGRNNKFLFVEILVRKKKGFEYMCWLRVKRDET